MSAFQYKTTIFEFAHHRGEVSGFTLYGATTLAEIDCFDVPKDDMLEMIKRADMHATIDAANFATLRIMKGD